jgi:chromate transport protein ChrA
LEGWHGTFAAMKKPVWILIGILPGVVVLLVVVGILANKNIPDVDNQLSALKPAILGSIHAAFLGAAGGAYRSTAVWDEILCSSCRSRDPPPPSRISSSP